MKLWLVCFLILFFGAEAIQWLGALPWFDSAELSLPLTVAGGIGLAIASNSAIFANRSPGNSGPSATQPEASSPSSPVPPPSSAIAAAAQPTGPKTRAGTVSFEIKKPRRG